MTQSLSYRRMLTRMGYYNYQNGLIFHHMRQSDGWEHHQAHCRSLILKALNLYKPEKVTVLGSGWLLELPLSELIERTGSVCLTDIIHPPDVISQLGNCRNVKLIEQDVTGGLIIEAWQKAAKFSVIKKMRTLENIVIPEFKAECDPGMVISLNILTQLEILIIDFLKKRSKIRKEEFDFFRTEIQRKHIEFLKRHRFVLISDYAEVITKRSGDTENVQTLMTELPLFKEREDWTWNFDQPGGDFYTSRCQFKVVGLIN